MSYAIIGFGKIGQALARAFARSGIEVSVATTRDPESFASAAAAIGPTIDFRDAIVPSLAPVADLFRSRPTRSDTIRCNRNGEISMSTQENVQIVKDFFAAMSRGDKQGLLAICAEDIEWVIPGEWALAGTHRRHEGLADLLQKASEMVETSYPQPPEFVAQGDRVLVVGFAAGRVKATNRTFEDDWVFAITVRNGKVTNIREYIDTLALARASEL
ncbi:ketosteroid isomerase-like protein [Burkholderia sp. Ch1-1]|uniref:nuclear transport factor 2 family protein n=1 Tax=Paraburkholderia sp. USG1 TaxID=2952268 RepID=UPI0001D23D88|nr:nuclear transport factor 2 family protein [Paraburkholderia sp. USG1]EIF31512.1 ketosteroid isomerase-like protein [Burkholderia sp. Ch1-1]MDR8398164.1 nuclear transport factor 2 family protein [Paraburkholderia sp. USG1]